MITADPSSAVLRPKYALISSDDAPMVITPIAHRVGGRDASRTSSSQEDHV
ncbi:MAG: hypothetical protein ABI810_15055 [Sphingomonas bacterium]